MMPKKSMPVAWENRTLQSWRDSKFHKLHKMRNMTWFTRLKNMETMGNRDVDWNENNQALKEADDAQKVDTHPPQQEFQKNIFMPYSTQDMMQHSRIWIGLCQDQKVEIIYYRCEKDWSRCNIQTNPVILSWDSMQEHTQPGHKINEQWLHIPIFE